MTTTRNRDDMYDEFETWLRSCPPAEPPTDLRARCLRAVPGDPRATRIFALASWRRLGARRGVKLVGGLSLAAAVLLMFLLAQGPESVFAEASRKSAAAPAVHFVETYSELERAPGTVQSSEWWVVPGVGRARALTIDGTVARRIVWHKSEVTTWDVENNEVTIARTSEAVDRVAPWLTDADSLEDYEKKAEEQGISIQVDTITRDGQEIRRVRIVDLLLLEQEDAKQKMTLIVDIDAATERIVRIWSHLNASGPNRDNFASLNSVHEFVIDYPDPEGVDRAIFELDYPADAKVTRDAPSTED